MSAEERYQMIKRIMRCIDGVELRERRGSQFHFPVYLTDGMIAAGIENMDLKVRAYNCLRRAGYSTIGKLAEDIANGMDPGKIRGCGADTVAEIMEKLFVYQFSILSAERKARFLLHVAKMNFSKQEG